MTSLDVRLKKASKVYREGEKLCGIVLVQSKGEVVHNGITLSVDGSVNMQLSAKSVGLFEAFYNSVKPITLISTSIEVVKAGKIPSGKTEIPFEIPLKALPNRQLHETYHGVFINIQYSVKCEMKRPLLNKDLVKTQEFMMESMPLGKMEPAKAVPFTISPDSLQNVKERTKVPLFLINGRLDSANCNISEPFTGELVVEKAQTIIKSIEVQLVRVETCGCAEGYAKDATEIQNLQIADGDVCRGLKLPIYMVFPRLFTCPTLATTNFKIEFEVNIVVVFHDDYLVTENFPIRIVRR